MRCGARKRGGKRKWRGRVRVVGVGGVRASEKRERGRECEAQKEGRIQFPHF